VRVRTPAAGLSGGCGDVSGLMRMAIPLSAPKGGSGPTRLLSSPAERSGRFFPACPAGLRRGFCFVTLLVILGASVTAARASTHTQRKLEAREQFDKAEQMREALNGRPAAERTRKDYQRLADAYRKVYYVDPASSKADASIIAVAEILAEMGRQFEPKDKYLHASIGEYAFLRREYPGSKYRFQALFTIGQIYKEDLDDADAARQSFEEFVRRYPHNPLAADARQALAELNQPAPAGKPAEDVAVEKSAPPAKNSEEQDRAAEKPSPVKSAGEEAHGPEPTEASLQMPAPIGPKKLATLPMVTGIRHWSTPDYTRVAIDVDAEVKYEAGRVPDPDRIFFDLPNTRLASVLVGKSFEVRDGLLKKIRVAQFQPGYTRVVLEVADVADYSAFLLPNPYRLIIDIHGRQPQSQTEVARAHASGSADNDAGTTTTVEKEKSYRSVEKANEAGNSSTVAQKEEAAPGRAAATSHSRAAETGSRKVVVDNADADDETASAKSVKRQDTHISRTTEADSTGWAPSSDDAAKPVSAAKRASSRPAVETAAVRAGDPLFSGPRDSDGPELKATTGPTSAPTAIAVAPRSKETKTTAGNRQVESEHEAAPTSFGDRSLTRTLGLKIGRIVIDAGHGGHDTGTIGPDGLMEKDLVLDVALRLGHLLETRLGADVIYTRHDDTFIPLETRTAIANQHQADLFISIHANSSPDPSARGVETYYLNFTSDPAALEVAARENAVSQKSIFELQDLVKKITLKDKIEESRELATDVQLSLYSGLAGKHSTLRNRGVKKAPFVVLIGANMPSILAEISFVSNPTDEAKLETSEYRQKIAEALYKGIAKYAGGLSGVKVATRFSKETDQ